MFKIQEVHSLHMKFPPVTLEVNPGEIIGITGGSGSGKTVFLKALSDMIEHEGKVFLDGIEQAKFSPSNWRKKVTLLPAEVFFFEKMVLDELKKTDDKSFLDMGFKPETIHLKKTSSLSSGEKQRVGFLRVLENKPEVMLLDEPSANLDEKNKASMESIAKKYILENKACIIWVSHDLNQLKRVSSKIYKIENNEFMEI